MLNKPNKFDYQIILFSYESDYDNNIDFGSLWRTSNNGTYFCKNNKLKILGESFHPIAPGINVNNNSLNIIIEAQGQGKFNIILCEIIQISRSKNSNFYQIVYISKKGVINDSTFKAQYEILKLHAKAVFDTNADDYLEE